jgi:hypothetical protein
MLSAKRIAKEQKADYATGADFCLIFEKDMNRLYLLSSLLTNDPEMAEQCFVGGLEDAKNSNPVFKEWAEAWARRTIIQNAIRMVQPRPENHTASATGHDKVDSLPAELNGIAGLPAFERFVFVMAVLERFSDQECSLLLGCSRSDVVEGRTRALGQIVGKADPGGELVSIATDPASRSGEPASALALGVFPHLAASA